MKGSDESRVLAIIFAIAAAAHLGKARLFDSLVPNRLDPFRREIEVTTSCWHLAGAVTLCVPRLHRAARWVNLPLHVGALMGAVDTLRNPHRFHNHRRRTPAVQSLVLSARIPTHLLAITMILWVTRSRSSTSRAVAPGVQSPDRGGGPATPDPVTHDASPDPAAPAEDQ